MDDIAYAAMCALFPPDAKRVRDGTWCVAIPVLDHCPSAVLDPGFVWEEVVPGCPEFGCHLQPLDKPTFAQRMVALRRFGSYMLGYDVQTNTVYWWHA